MAEKEYIEREAAVLSLLDKGQHSRRYKLGEIWELDFEEIREAINSIPAADVRPVVLCRDCDMYECHEYDGGLKYVCRLFKRQMQEADFCSYGEKMEES